MNNDGAYAPVDHHILNHIQLLSCTTKNPISQNIGFQIHLVSFSTQKTNYCCQAGFHQHQAGICLQTGMEIWKENRTAHQSQVGFTGLCKQNGREIKSGNSPNKPNCRTDDARKSFFRNTFIAKFVSVLYGIHQRAQDKKRHDPATACRWKWHHAENNPKNWKRWC